jgi:ABC-type uncharacterized transport system substrate-binding protein
VTFRSHWGEVGATPWSPEKGRGSQRVDSEPSRSIYAGSAIRSAKWTSGQQAGKQPTIGFLGANTSSVQSRWTAAFTQRLRELGWIEGRNVAIEYRWAETRFERSPEIIAEFVRLKVDVIVTHATENILAAKQGTSVIPIVFAAVTSPGSKQLWANGSADQVRQSVRGGY